jgi:hypothetical protein
MPPAPVIKQVKELLINRTPISRFTQGPGYLLQHKNFTALRLAKPEIGILYESYMQEARSRGRIQGATLRRFANGDAAYQRKYLADIRALIPAHLPDDVQRDILQNISVALWDRSLHPSDVRSRISKFVTSHNRTFSTKYAKFGNNRLYSLDEVLFEDGSTTRHDTVSRGLWD